MRMKGIEKIEKKSEQKNEKKKKHYQYTSNSKLWIKDTLTTLSLSRKR